MTEEELYATIRDQMKDISDRAATFRNPAIGILSAQLHAELHAYNERRHQRVIEARESFVQTLQARLSNSQHGGTDKR